MKYYFPFVEELHSRWDRYLSHSSFKLKYLSPLLLLYCIAIVLYDWF